MRVGKAGKQLQSFTDIMKSGLIRTYAGLLAFSGSKFEIVDDEAIDSDARSASITQLVYGSGDRTYTVRYQMVEAGTAVGDFAILLSRTSTWARSIKINSPQPRSLLMAMWLRLWLSGISRPACRRIWTVNEAMIKEALEGNFRAPLSMCSWMALTAKSL